MGKGIDLARDTSPLHTAALDDFKDQLLIILIRRLGGHASIPLAECDDTGGLLLSFNVVDGVFNFSLEQKQ